MIEADRDGNGTPDVNSGWREIHDGRNAISLSTLGAARWRLKMGLNSTKTSGSPKILRVKITPRQAHSKFEMIMLGHGGHLNVHQLCERRNPLSSLRM